MNTIPTGALALQGWNPRDVLLILLLWGPNTVQRAIAQLAGRAITPVAFSFGWVAYSANTLLSVFSDGKLMPESEIRNLLIVGARSGFVRQTSSWALGRLFRDLDAAVDKEMEHKEEDKAPPVGSPHKPEVPPEAASSLSRRQSGDRKSWEALRISIFRVVEDKHRINGIPTIDWVWAIGWLTIVVQLVVSMIPWVRSEDPKGQLFLIAASGTLFSLLGSSLPQWSAEKWASPKRGGATVTLTQGNGYRHAITILGQQGVGLDLEILAAGTRTAPSSNLTRVLCACLAAFWLGLVLSVAALQHHAWYLLAIGLLGTVQNIIASAMPRHPSALGFHLELVETLRGKTVSEVLKEAETKYPSVGASLTPIFFPVSSSSMRVTSSDVPFWQKVHEDRHQENRFGVRIDDIPYNGPFDAEGRRRTSE